MQQLEDSEARAVGSQESLVKMPASLLGHFDMDPPL